MALSPLPKKKLTDSDITDTETETETPIRYLPLDRVYSSTSAQCYAASGASNVMSKKVKARKLDLCTEEEDADEDRNNKKMKKLFANVYTRRRKKPRFSESVDNNSNYNINNNSLVETRVESGFEVNLVDFDSLTVTKVDESNVEVNQANLGEEVKIVSESVKIEKKVKKRGIGGCELAGLGIDSNFLKDTDMERRLRSTNFAKNLNSGSGFRKFGLTGCSSSGPDQVKRWTDLSFENVDEGTFVGFQCKVYWPIDDEWYTGRVDSYNSETGKHHVKYDDFEEESLLFAKEKIKFNISREEMQRLNLKYKVVNKDDIEMNNEELVVLAAMFDDSGDIEIGDIIWVKLQGHSVWPAVVVNESDVCVRKGLMTNSGERSVPVQFFGTHDFAWINVKQAISFLRGLHLSFHLKCKQARFRKSLDEAKVYLSEQILPNKMLQLQNGIEVDDCESGSGEDDDSNSSEDDYTGAKKTKRTSNCTTTCPFEIDDLRVVSLGNIVTDSEFFHDERYIWPEGYTAERKFISAKDPSVKSCYKMEVLRDPEMKFRPLFRVTMDGGEQFKSSTPSACWNKIYKRIKKIGGISSNGFSTREGLEIVHKSGSHMFGFSDPKVSKIIKELSKSTKSSIRSGSKLASKRHQDLPVGYRPVRVEWMDLDKCNVCHMDEEYANNVFLQCDKCRMMVHARCYGELEAGDGVLWLCNLCRPDAPEFPPPCCLCPVIGGAMKRTTDGRWAHLACAIWIPETCLSDIKRMEPIDGLSRISKDRWKLLCSICGVTYGACIQCSNITCRVAYHPLCARAAGLCIEPEDEDQVHQISFEEDEEDQCIRLLSFCKKHRQPSNERSPSEDQMQPVVRQCSKYIPPSNPSGCARSEPYDCFGRRGQKEPEAFTAGSLKRLYVENRPYMVTGFCQNGTGQTSSSSNETMLSRFSSSLPKSKPSLLETSETVLSMAEKFAYMKKTVRMRLAFGKSGIHRFGVFAKHPHRAGDMVIEYTGEVVRPPIADKREHFIYNSLVGAGTYMFRIDDERVIDATRAGSIAHLINHSCEPNCYSRGVTIHGQEHIIIFAKRDISMLEELTYDYRFFSIGEQLACYCGFPRCRGAVNEIEPEGKLAKLWVPRSELIGWKEDQVDKGTSCWLPHH